MTESGAAATRGRAPRRAGSDPHGSSGLIDRGELVAALDRAAEHQVTIVSAQAGSGKTSLLRAWADRPDQPRHVAFMSVRPAQQDSQLFWLTLLGTVRAAATGADEAEPPPPAPGFNEPAMVDKALAELAAAAGPVALVIDDLHELDSAETLDQLTLLLTNLPPHVHAVLATRRDPALRLHRLRLAGELAEIRGDRLRFTEEETRRFLAATGIHLSGQAAALLHQRTEGWAAGLRLAALSLAGHPDPEQFVAEFSGSDRTVAEYLIAEMLDRQPSDVQRLLLRTSLLDRVNGELADLLTGSSGSERILFDLEDANAFVTSLDSDRTWFRYHHLFGGLLRLELRRRMAGEIPGLHRVAATWFAEHAQPADAVRHMQAAGDRQAAARLLTDHALSLTLDGKAGTVRALLRSFPQRTGGDQPELAVVFAIADLDQLRLDHAAAHLDIARSYAATIASDRRCRLDMAIVSLDLLLARLRGDFTEILERAGSLPVPIAGQSTAAIALAGDLRALALLNLGVTEAWSMRLLESEQHLLEGAELARRIERPYLEVACRAELGFASTVHSLALARRRSEEALALAARHGWDGEPVIAPALATLASTMIWMGEFDAGERWLDRAIRATRSGTEPGLRLLLPLIAGMLDAARGDHRQALDQFTVAGRVQSQMVGEHALGPQVTGWTIATQARLGMLREARAALDALTGPQADRGEIRGAAAVVSLAAGDPARARRELELVLNGAAPAIHGSTLVEAHVLDGLARRALGDDQATRAAVERALRLAEPDRLILPFLMTGGWSLLQGLPLRRSEHPALIADILDVGRGATPPGGTVAPPAEQLSPSELRVLRYLPTNLTRIEIAGDLSVSLNTVNTHVRNIYAKLGVTDRSAAVQRARELRLLGRGRG